MGHNIDQRGEGGGGGGGGGAGVVGRQAHKLHFKIVKVPVAKECFRNSTPSHWN